MMCFSEHWLFVWTSRRMGAVWDDLMTPSISGRIGHVPDGKFFWARWKKESVPAQLLMPEDTWPFLLLMKKMYQVILVWGSTLVSDACIHAGSYTANTVKVASSQITHELFGRAEERKTNVSFPFTSMTCLQLSPVVSTADHHVWSGGEVVSWWWMCRSRL